MLFLVHGVQLFQKRLEPAVARRLHDAIVQLVPPLFLLLGAHLERPLDAVGALPVVPRVDGNFIVAKDRGAAREFTENQRAVLVMRCVGTVLADEVLVAGQIHALALAGNHQGIGHGQQRNVLGVADVLLQVHQRLVGQIGPGRVDTSHDIRDGGVELALIRRRGGDLDHDNLVAPLGVLVEKEFIGEQLLSHPTDVVELVTGDNQFHALVSLLKGIEPESDIRVRAVLFQGNGIDANGHVDDINMAVLELDARRRGLDAQETTARLEKVARILLDLETDEIGTEHALEEFLAHGETAKDFRRGKRDVKEEANLGIWQLLANHLGHEEQMVIVNPDDIAALVIAHNLVGKGLVDLDIVDPGVVLVRLALGIVGNLVVEDGPENLFAKVTVVTIEITVLADDGETVKLRRQTVLNVLQTLRVLEGVGWHAQRADPDLVRHVAAAYRGLDRIANAAIALLGQFDRPVGVSKDAIRAGAAMMKLRLANTRTTQLGGLVEQLIVLQQVLRRRGAGARSRLRQDASTAPDGRVRIIGCGR